MPSAPRCFLHPAVVSGLSLDLFVPRALLDRSGLSPRAAHLRRALLAGLERCHTIRQGSGPRRYGLPRRRPGLERCHLLRQGSGPRRLHVGGCCNLRRYGLPRRRPSLERCHLLRQGLRRRMLSVFLLVPASGVCPRAAPRERAGAKL